MVLVKESMNQCINDFMNERDESINQSTNYRTSNAPKSTKEPSSDAYSNSLKIVCQGWFRAWSSRSHKISTTPTPRPAPPDN